MKFSYSKIEFFGPETQLVVSRRFHLTIYRVLHEESESELKNDQILQPYAVFLIFRTLKKFKIYFLDGSLTNVAAEALVDIVLEAKAKVSSAYD